MIVVDPPWEILLLSGLYLDMQKEFCSLLRPYLKQHVAIEISFGGGSNGRELNV
jgi:hypothetical protein